MTAIPMSSAPTQADYNAMYLGVLAALIRRAGGAVTVTRAEFERMFSIDMQFASGEDAVTVRVSDRWLSTSDPSNS